MTYIDLLPQFSVNVKIFEIFCTLKSMSCMLKSIHVLSFRSKEVKYVSGQMTCPRILHYNRENDAITRKCLNYPTLNYVIFLTPTAAFWHYMASYEGVFL